MVGLYSRTPHDSPVFGECQSQMFSVSGSSTESLEKQWSAWNRDGLCKFYFSVGYSAVCQRGFVTQQMSCCAAKEMSEIPVASVFTLRQLTEMCTKHPGHSRTDSLCLLRAHTRSSSPQGAAAMNTQ